MAQAQAQAGQMFQTFQKEVSALQQNQKDLQSWYNTRMKYESQKNENEMVLKELELLEDDAQVYKLVGPALVGQDLEEARNNVQKRIEFISSSLKNTDSKIENLNKEQNEKRQKVAAIQQHLQQQQQRLQQQQQSGQ
eukprot:gb/GECH01012732.1/.p1 GENE.gb/GECH01012732.1/~~gb/GECH01012732.1/.p1  ORF type:complete len:137 (+),score=59.56 gb/GECH01012732.1/:1-411(+)